MAFVPTPAFSNLYSGVLLAAEPVTQATMFCQTADGQFLTTQQLGQVGVLYKRHA